MNEQLQSQLAAILGSIHTGVAKASDFAMAELPSIAQQYVMYGRASITLGVVLGLVAFFTAYKLARFGASQTKYGEETEQILGICGAIAAGFIGLVLLLLNTSAALLVWFAPKVWLLKELAQLIK
jgi:hypothetical protein